LSRASLTPYHARVIYLNQAGTSWPKPAPVRAAAAAALAAPPQTWADGIETWHGEVAAALGIEDTASLLITPGATSALHVGVSDHPWQAGDRIVISGLEHHALHRPVQLLGRHGVEVVVIPRTHAEPAALEALEAELRRGRVRMVAVTAACNVTGELLPVDEIVRLARAHGALSLIDAAQVAGWLPLPTGPDGADLIVFAGHKGPHGPTGTGGLYVAPNVATASPRAVCEMSDADTPPCSPRPGYCDVGSVDRAALAGLAAGLRWVQAPERARRLSRARKQAEELASALLENPTVTLHGPRSPEARMPTLALTFSDRSPGAVATALLARGAFASAGEQCAPLAHQTLGTSPNGVLRLSFGPANGEGDAAAAAAALREILV